MKYNGREFIEIVCAPFQLAENVGDCNVPVLRVLATIGISLAQMLGTAMCAHQQIGQFDVFWTTHEAGELQ